MKGNRKCHQPGKQNGPIVLWSVMVLWLFLSPFQLTAGKENEKGIAEYRLEVTEKSGVFRVPYRNLTFGDCFRLVSRNQTQWSWAGNRIYDGRIRPGQGTEGFFDGIPLPGNILPGEYEFDLFVGATFDGITCYSEPQPLIIVVRALGGSLLDTICSGERFIYIPHCITAGEAVADDYYWQRSAVEGIREIAVSGTGGIDEVLTNTTYGALNVKYVYTVRSNTCFPEAGFEIVVTVNPVVDFQIVNDRVELCDGEMTDIHMRPDIAEVSYMWDVEAFGVGGAEYNSGKLIRQQLHYEEAPATVLYRISAVLTGGGTVCSEPQTAAVRVKSLPEISLNWIAPADRVTLGNPISIQAYPEYYDMYRFNMNGFKTEQKNSELVCYDWKEGGENRVTVTVTSDEGCSNTDSLVFTGPELKLPNVITPNGDGINDRLFDGFELEVFNRNGSQLYRGKDGWDGIYQGQPVPSGTYLYVVHYVSPDGQKMMKKYHVYVNKQ